MNNGRWLALSITAATVVLIVISILHPNQSAEALADAGTTGLLRPSSTPEAAVDNLAREIGQRHWGSAYSRLANKGEFTEQEFIRDLTGTYLSLRTYASLDHFEVRPLHASADDAQMQLKMYWSTRRRHVCGHQGPARHTQRRSMGSGVASGEGAAACRRRLFRSIICDGM